jgi:hypothetical protein
MRSILDFVGLAIEFAALFLIGPALIAWAHTVAPIPALWVGVAYCAVVLRRDPRFSARGFWNASGLGQYAPAIAAVFLGSALAAVLLIERYAPDIFLNLPKANTRLWGSLMILYPLLSVFPQGIVYRVFVFARYGPLFGSGKSMLLASAAAFSCAHIVMHNALAVGLTFVAGLLFAFRYRQTGSMFISSFEHALYGCAVFTIGLGQWFYHGALLH